MAKINKVLVVEDDVFIAELYIRALRKAGYDVTHAPAGLKALEEGKSGKYDLMLLDIMVPEMTGVEVLHELRKEKSHDEKTKIIIATNLEQDEETRQAVENLADGYIIKADITPKVLVGMIQEIESSGTLSEVSED